MPTSKQYSNKLKKGHGVDSTIPDSDNSNLIDYDPKLNATAYRIHRFLQWLMSGPISASEVNQRFLEDPNIGCTVSIDSIWFYMNTLKALGCEIRRTNVGSRRYQYELIQHPFGLQISPVQLETLAEVKSFAQTQFSHSEMRTLDQLLKKMILNSTSPDPNEAIERLFEQSRSLDYQAFSTRLTFIESILAESQSQVDPENPPLLSVTYLSPLKGEETFDFLPKALYYDQGVVYLRGECLEHPESEGALRVDRIIAVSRSKDYQTFQSLQAASQKRIQVVVHVFAPSEAAFSGFHLTENQGCLEETQCWVAGKKPYCEVTLSLRSLFVLKQRLYSCGFPFQIITPKTFREDVKQSLTTMLGFYERGI